MRIDKSSNKEVSGKRWKGIFWTLSSLPYKQLSWLKHTLDMKRKRAGLLHFSFTYFHSAATAATELHWLWMDQGVNGYVICDLKSFLNLLLLRFKLEEKNPNLVWPLNYPVNVDLKGLCTFIQKKPHYEPWKKHANKKIDKQKCSVLSFLRNPLIWT